MKVSFKIDYGTYWGQRLYICGSIEELGGWDVEKAFALECPFPDTWEGDFNLSTNRKKSIEYKYFLKDEHTGEIQWEWGKNRTLILEPARFNEMRCRDFWRSEQNIENAMFSSAFTDVIMKRPSDQKKVSSSSSIIKGKVLRIQIYAPRVGVDYQLCLVGDQPTLGNWDPSQALILDDAHYPVWSIDIDASKLQFPLQYKYGLYHNKRKNVVSLEDGNNRMIRSLVCEDKKSIKIQTDINYRYPVGMWKGAGMAIPIFSLRTKNSFGVGEFADLIPLVNWVKRTGLKLIQVLPVNETIVTHTWTDSYPYSSISVFALHPIYLNLEKLGKVNDKAFMLEFDKTKELLNSLDAIDYETVLRFKSGYYKKMFDQERDEFLADDDFKEFYKTNQEWLVPYAAFCYLRDKYETADFSQWEEFALYNAEKLKKLTDSTNENFDDIAVHYYIQYHLHKQLLEASEYARNHGVVLKGDIPVGIDRHSVEMWQHPQLFNSGYQTGAPPDDFTAKGQNWGFPTYNWEEMSKEGYAWWRERLIHMARYFDAYRIDHILGFFRMWEIPNDAVTAILGKFNPALPLTRDELQDQEIWFDYERLCEPFIREYFLWDIFGELKESVENDFLDEIESGVFKLKKEFNTQKKIDDYFTYGREESELSANEIRIRDGLFELCEEIIFIPDSNSHGEGFHPRICMDESESFINLDEDIRNILESLYIEYFFHRHNEFWKQEAFRKLPPIITATRMLACGEDLGMIPRSVPEVMNAVGILSLEVQRMPKDPDIDFLHPADVPYLSVSTTSTHDMTTLREWWQEDRERSQRFYNQVIAFQGEAPYFCEPWLVKEILNQHLLSKAMWAIIPFQDLIAMSGNLRREDPSAERINNPSNSKHYWRYRMHLNIEDLLMEQKFNEMLYEMVNQSGRNSDY